MPEYVQMVLLIWRSIGFPATAPTFDLVSRRLAIEAHSDKNSREADALVKIGAPGQLLVTVSPGY